MILSCASADIGQLSLGCFLEPVTEQDKKKKRDQSSIMHHIPRFWNATCKQFQGCNHSAVDQVFINHV